MKKTRLFAMGTAALISAALAACGGGGGGGGGGVVPTTPPATATPPPTPSPTPTVTPNPFGCVGSPSSVARRTMASPPHPIAAGDTFTYAGNLSQVYTQSAPCAEPTSTTSATIAITVTDSATTAPGSFGAATDQQSQETDTYPTQTITTTTNQTLQNAASQFLLFATTSADSIGNAITTAYTNPQVLDELPETSGATWDTNSPAGTVTETLADGTHISRTVQSDGSYTDTETYVDGSTAKISVDGKANGKSLDGGGSYTVAGSTFTYSPPSAGIIKETITGAATKSRTFPAWFSVPTSYISDTFVDNGQVAFDASCSVSGSIGSSGQQIVETYKVLDPVLGYIETRTTTSYFVAGFGAACVKISDTLDSYYDYQNDTTRIDYQSQNGKPNSVNQIVEFLSMNSPTTAYPAVRTQSESAVSPARVAARIAAIDHMRAIEVAQRAEALHYFVKQFVRKGAVR